MHFVRVSVVDSIQRFRQLATPRCDVINHVIRPHTDDQYRNATRFFTSVAQPPPSPGDVTDDVTTSRDPGWTPTDVTPAAETFRLVLLCLDVIILFNRACRVCRVVNRMRNYWSRDDRKYYYYDEEDDDEDYGLSAMMVEREGTKHTCDSSLNRRVPTEVDQVDDALYQIAPSQSSSSSSSSRGSTVTATNNVGHKP